MEHVLFYLRATRSKIKRKLSSPGKETAICQPPRIGLGPAEPRTIWETLTIRAALTTHELEWLEPWGKLAELELKCSNRELVYVGNTNVTQST